MGNSMALNRSCVIVEVFVEVFLELWIFVQTYGSRRKWGRWSKIVVWLAIALVLLWLNAFHIKTPVLISINSVLVDVPMYTLILWILTGCGIVRVFAWCFFCFWTYTLIKLPVLILSGLIYGISLSEHLIGNVHSWMIYTNCIILIVLFIICVKGKEKISWYLKESPHLQAGLILIGFLEGVITIYIMNIGWEGFTIHMLIFTFCLILVLFLVIIILSVLYEYNRMVRIHNLLKVTENNLQANYKIIRQEMETNRKQNHDIRHDWKYLLSCLQERNYQRCETYIRNKVQMDSENQHRMVWTGSVDIDFLLNCIKEQADKKEIALQIDAEVLELPIANYDFFLLLSNLLENALEGASQCEKGSGRISLWLYAQNGKLSLMLENNYRIEPKKKGKRLMSSKGEGSLHGWGVESVKDIVEKYQGTITITYGDGIFMVKIVLIQ